MDLDAVAEWSRLVVSAAVIVYLTAWLAFCAEAGTLSRARRTAAAAQEHERELVTAGSHGAGAGATSVSDDAVEPGHAHPSGEVEQQAERMGRIGRVVLIAATVVLAIGVSMRGLGTERMPWGNMYEFSITGALVASVVFLGLARTAAGRAVAVWAVLLVFITLGAAVTVLYVPPGPLQPALESYWLVIHVGMAVVAFGLFTVSAVISALQIVAERSAKRGAVHGFGASLPPERTLDRLAYRLTAVGFPIWTFGPLILGAVWAEVSWGRFWGWDPKEVWALITWLAYAAYLHARATAGWKGSKASVVALIAYATVLFSYFGVNIFFNGLHSYGGL
ncbi:cytochrome c-type biogenesis protein CcsB [Haloactinopolyspora alba]|uniref:Cytochrome c-type biogenesis protein CcsB n=1 Tax=Haloactinopolyspora alba TaxID=648780 RepID=A0A2P8DGQ4_9ACTN|nr:c-type cytochrome biogenesis protein CcsB [Haloactinopolyspora alba]PSK96381.1 cytochrome c-type biogenesis protein CcsB [Haloactinopolyspora alba]